MPQKCMFTPTEISKMSYSISDLVKTYKITPGIYRVFISELKRKRRGVKRLEDLLREKWNFQYGGEDLEKLKELLGLA